MQVHQQPAAAPACGCSSWREILSHTYFAFGSRQKHRVRWKTKPVFRIILAAVALSWTVCLCVCLCVCSTVTGRHLLVLWALETASTRADPKTRVSGRKHVNKVRFRIFLNKQLSQVYLTSGVSALQWWMRSTMSYWWWSPQTKPSHPGRSAWSDQPAATYRSPSTQTQSRWPHGSLRKVSRNRKSPVTLIDPPHKNASPRPLCPDWNVR